MAAASSARSQLPSGASLSRSLRRVEQPIGVGYRRRPGNPRLPEAVLLRCAAGGLLLKELAKMFEAHQRMDFQLGHVQEPSSEVEQFLSRGDVD